MSGYLKFPSGLFLEKAELERFKQFLDDNGFRKWLLANSTKFGLIKNQYFIYDSSNRINDISINNEFINGLVYEGSSLSINYNPIVAIDSDGKLISLDAGNKIVPADSKWYWVKIKHKYNPEEIGTVSVDIQGTLTGVGTKFTEVLRGQPNFPAKIRFTDSSSNTAWYDVLEVIDDTNAVLDNASFTAESDLKYCVVGTFTPASVPTDIDIFQYDSCLLSLEVETTLNTAPLSTTGKDFFLARVRNTGTALTIQDKRNDIWRTVSDFEFFDIYFKPNPLVGVSQIRWDGIFTTKEKNRVRLEWGFSSDNWTIDSATNKITLNSGSGGIFKETFYFNDTNFDGWRVYREDGKYDIIKISSKNATQINLVLDHLDPNDYLTKGGTLFICPPYEEIEFKFYNNQYNISNPTGDDVIGNNQEPFVFNIFQKYGEAFVTVPSQTTPYKFRAYYRYKKFNFYTPWTVLPDDVVGYYNENSFTDAGVLKDDPGDRTRVPYTPSILTALEGFILLTPKVDSYFNTIKKLDTGDLYGIETIGLSNAVPVVDLYIGKARQYQYFNGNDLTLTADLYISLKDTIINDLGQPCINGNYFMLHFKQKINTGSFKVRIVQDYVDPTDYTLIKEFDTNDLYFIKQSEEGLFIRVSFDGTKWIINSVNEAKLLQSVFSERKGTSPNLAAGASGTLTYTSVLTFDTIKYDLNNIFFNVNFYFTTSNNGSGARATIGVKIKINGTEISGSNRNLVIHEAFFTQNYSYNANFSVYLSNSLFKGDIVEILWGTSAGFTPVATLDKVDAQISGDITNY